MASRNGPRRAAKPKGEPKQIIIAPLPEAERIANGLIEAHHSHLINAKILYLSTTAKRKKCDKVRLGSAQRVSGLSKYLAAAAGTPADFIVLIGATDWQWMTEDKRRALVDHELEHCWRITDDHGRDRWTIRGHDVEEFASIISRHGLWKQDLKEFADVARQLPLDQAAPAFTPEGEKESVAA